MAENKSNKNFIAGLGIIAPVITATIPVIKEIVEKKPQKNLIRIPVLYGKHVALSVNDAKTILENCGLKTIARKISNCEANPKFRNHFDNQVIFSNPSSGKKVDSGTTVYLKYITQDVIEKSKMLYEEKENIKMKKNEKRKTKIANVTKKIMMTVQKNKDGDGL